MPTEFNPTFPESAQPTNTASIEQNIKELSDYCDAQREAIDDVRVANDIYVKSLQSLTTIVQELTNIIPKFNFVGPKPGTVTQGINKLTQLTGQATKILSLVKKLGV